MRYSCWFSALKGGDQKAGDRLFSRDCCDRTKVDGFYLKQGVLG